MELEITRDFRSDRLSLYRTENVIGRYAELRDERQLPALADLYDEAGGRIYVIGNGSNLFLSRSRITSPVVKNSLPRGLERRADGLWWVSGTTNVMEVLRFCLRESLGSFYYLASVPATIGGAVAMNAGRGRNSGGSIFDFIKRVRYYDLEAREIREINGADAVKGYRSTIFTGATSKVVLEASFEFPPGEFAENPIEARKTYAASAQDYSGPNCGSVFMLSDPAVIRFTKRIGLRVGGARFSRKTPNWIVNEMARPAGIAAIVRLVELWHGVLRRPVRREIITVR